MDKLHPRTWKLFVNIASSQHLWHIESEEHPGTSVCRRDETAALSVPFEAMGTTPVCAMCIEALFYADESEEAKSEPKNQIHQCVYCHKDINVLDSDGYYHEKRWFCDAFCAYEWDKGWVRK